MLNQYTNAYNISGDQLVNARTSAGNYAKEKKIFFKSLSNKLIKGIHVSTQYIRTKLFFLKRKEVIAQYAYNAGICANLEVTGLWIIHH